MSVERKSCSQKKWFIWTGKGLLFLKQPAYLKNPAEVFAVLPLQPIIIETSLTPEHRDTTRQSLNAICEMLLKLVSLSNDVLIKNHCTKTHQL